MVAGTCKQHTEAQESGSKASLGWVVRLSSKAATVRKHTGKNREPPSSSCPLPVARCPGASVLNASQGLVKRNNWIPSLASAPKLSSDFHIGLQPTLSPLITSKANLNQMLKVTNHRLAKSIEEYIESCNGMETSPPSINTCHQMEGLPEFPSPWGIQHSVH